MQTSLIINATDTNGAVTKTVTDVNSAAAGSVAHEYGRQLNALTTNNFLGVNRVDKESLDSNKITPTLTLAKVTDTIANIRAADGRYTVGIDYDGDGQLSVDFHADIADKFNGYAFLVWTIIDGQLVLISTVASNIATSIEYDYTLIVRASETDTCNAVSATFTIA